MDSPFSVDFDTDVDEAIHCMKVLAKNTVFL